jgi:outer membrane protein assembly factor BamB
MPTFSRWRESGGVLLASLALLPPVGLVLVWLRPRMGIASRLAGSAVAVALSVAYLVLFFGLRMELDGSGSRPLFSFKKESHYEALERSRAEQARTAQVRAGQAVVEPSAEATVHAASQAPPSAPAKPEAAKVEPVSKASASDWPAFRGLDRLGHYREMPILTSWPPRGLDRVWKQPVGGGYASFAIAGGRAYTIEQRRDQEVAAAYDIKTGRELWTNAWRGFFQESMGGDGPRTTPTYDEGRIYVLGAEGEFRCLDAASGKVLWQKNILKENGAENLQWGMSASPLIVEDKVIVLPGGRGGKSVVAYDKLTGKTIWSSLSDRQSYTSPMIVTLAGQRQLLVVSAERAMGLTVEKGELLWDYPWVTEYEINSSQPIVTAPNRFFISAGYGHGAALVEVSKNGDKFAARTVWKNISMKNKFTSSVLHEGHVYGLDEAILACVEVETGKLKWKGGRYGFGQVLLADGHVIVLSETGELALVRAAPDKHTELARFSAIEGKTWNHPAIDDGLLLVRNAEEMAAFRIAR